MENLFGILATKFRLLLGTMEQSPKIVRDTPGQTGRAPTTAVLQNEQELHVPDENYKNSLSEPKHQRELLKDYLNHLGAFTGQEDRN